MSTSRSNPIRLALDSAAAGHVPNSTEVSAVVAAVAEGVDQKTKELWRRRFEQACRAAALAHAGGEMGSARRVARQASVELADALDAAGAEPWSRPDPFEHADPQTILGAIRR